MSLRDKAKEIKAAGEAERGNFTPDGVPKRAYQWWLKESRSKRAREIRYGNRRENFCHFWRVVLFWAPLRKVVYGIDKFVFNGYVGGALLALIGLGLLTLAVLNPLNALVIVGIIIAMLLQGVGALAGASAALSPDERHEYDMMTNKTAIGVFFALGFVLSIPVFLVAKAIRGYKSHLTEYNVPIALTVIGLLITGILVAVGVGGGVPALFTVLGIAAIVVVGFFFLRIVLSNLGSLIQGKRAVAYAKREDAKAVYLAENGELPPHVPGKVEKFFTGLGDFLVLVSQVIRTKKWKICPMVEIDA